MPVLIIVGIIVILIIWIVSLYNGLVRLRNRRQNAFADIDVQLRQRHDLVPQLVETVKGYAAHEKDLLLKVTEARTAAVSATTIDGKIAAEQQLSSALQGLKVQVEAYPDLKANQNFLQLQGSWNEIEEQISAARRAYNAAVTDYNNAVEQFPTNIFAGMMKFGVKPVLDIPEEERKNISAKDLFKN